MTNAFSVQPYELAAFFVIVLIKFSDMFESSQPFVVLYARFIFAERDPLVSIVRFAFYFYQLNCSKLTEDLMQKRDWNGCMRVFDVAYRMFFLHNIFVRSLCLTPTIFFAEAT